MKAILHPARSVTLASFGTIAIGRLLLMLPAARADGAGAPWIVALFTAVPAVCSTGLLTVDTGSYWSTSGQATIMGLFQLGVFGMMTAATLLGLRSANRKSMAAGRIARCGQVVV